MSFSREVKEAPPITIADPASAACSSVSSAVGAPVGAAVVSAGVSAGSSEGSSVSEESSSPSADVSAAVSAANVAVGANPTDRAPAINNAKSSFFLIVCPPIDEF